MAPLLPFQVLIMLDYGLGLFRQKMLLLAEALQIVESEITKLKKEGVTDADLQMQKAIS